jgi:hypothetical protein
MEETKKHCSHNETPNLAWDILCSCLYLRWSKILIYLQCILSALVVIRSAIQQHFTRWIMDPPRGMYSLWSIKRTWLSASSKQKLCITLQIVTIIFNELKATHLVSLWQTNNIHVYSNKCTTWFLFTINLAYMFRPIRPSSGHQSLRTPRTQLVKINKNIKSGVVCGHV